MGETTNKGKTSDIGPQSSGQQSTSEQGSMDRTTGWGRRPQQLKSLLDMIDACAEEYYRTIENLSDRASFGTNLVKPLGSPMTVYSRSPVDHCLSTHLKSHSIEALRKYVDHPTYPAYPITSIFRIYNDCGRERHRAEHAPSAGGSIPGEPPCFKAGGVNKSNNLNDRRRR